MSRYQGKINNLKKLVVSDPHYKKDVWCRYGKDFKEAKDWNLDLALTNYDEVIDGSHIKGASFILILTDPDIKNSDKLIFVGKDEMDLLCSKSLLTNKTDIGMDTAQISIGVNQKADEIDSYSEKVNNPENELDVLDDYRPSLALGTLTDGHFGEVIEYTNNKNELVGISLTGWFCDDTNYSNDDILNYLEDRLEIKNLTCISMEIDMGGI